MALTIKEKLKFIYTKCSRGESTSLQLCSANLYLTKRIDIEIYKKLLTLARNKSKDNDILLINLLYQIINK